MDVSSSSVPPWFSMMSWRQMASPNPEPLPNARWRDRARVVPAIEAAQAIRGAHPHRAVRLREEGVAAAIVTRGTASRTEVLEHPVLPHEVHPGPRPHPQPARRVLAQEVGDAVEQPRAPVQTEHLREPSTLVGEAAQAQRLHIGHADAAIAPRHQVAHALVPQSLGHAQAPEHARLAHVEPISRHPQPSGRVPLHAAEERPPAVRQHLLAQGQERGVPVRRHGSRGLSG